MKRLQGSLAVAFAILALSISGVLAEELNHPREYARCMAMTKSDPNDAFQMASAWKELGGNDAAEHCAAVALLYGGRPEHAARRLEVLAKTVVASPDFKGQILAQAGQAWLLAGDPAHAEAALTSAIELRRNRPEVMIDRAQARAAMADYQGAVDDLNVAIDADPTNGDAFKFRASAYRYLDKLEQARADIDRALALDPEDPAAFLESGIIFRLAGDDARARDEWLIVLEIDPDGDIGRTARANIEKMDVKIEP